MPHVKLICQISGARDGAHWPGIGETIDVPEDEAADLIAARYAVAVDDAESDDEVDPVEPVSLVKPEGK